MAVQYCFVMCVVYGLAVSCGYGTLVLRLCCFLAARDLRMNIS
jgi:hypothetical protein